MTFIEIVLISIGLAMDAFVVSICKGLSINKVKIKHCVIVGLWFGIFQTLMPTIGFLLGTTFERFIVGVDHWVAFFLLLIIGGRMALDVFKDSEDEDDDLSFKKMLMLAIATSIDALAIGIAYVCAYRSKNALMCFSMIGIITFFISFIGVKIGSIFGNKLQKKAQIFGGLVLILVGIKILFEHII